MHEGEESTSEKYIETNNGYPNSNKTQAQHKHSINCRKFTFTWSSWYFLITYVYKGSQTLESITFLTNHHPVGLILIQEFTIQ